MLQTGAQAEERAERAESACIMVSISKAQLSERNHRAIACNAFMYVGACGSKIRCTLWHGKLIGSNRALWQNNGPVPCSTAHTASAVKSAYTAQPA